MGEFCEHPETIVKELESNIETGLTSTQVQERQEKFGKNIAGAQYSKYIVIKRGDFSYNKGNSKAYPHGCIYCLENYDSAAVPNVFYSFRFTSEYAFPQYYKYIFERII